MDSGQSQPIFDSSWPRASSCVRLEPSPVGIECTFLVSGQHLNERAGRAGYRNLSIYTLQSPLSVGRLWCGSHHLTGNRGCVYWYHGFPSAAQIYAMRPSGELGDSLHLQHHLVGCFYSYVAGVRNPCPMDMDKDMDFVFIQTRQD